MFRYIRKVDGCLIFMNTYILDNVSSFNSILLVKNEKYVAANCYL